MRTKYMFYFSWEQINQKRKEFWVNKSVVENYTDIKDNNMKKRDTNRETRQLVKQ